MSASQATAGFGSAVSEWTTLLGSKWVCVSSEQLETLERGTFLTHGRVLAHLHPGSVDEVAECVRIAARHGQRVNVFSKGKNYGYSACGPSNGITVAIELSRLNDITEFDDELGYVRIQAGVTFGQLIEFLSRQGTLRYLPATGGPADGSILANTVERGHGLGFGGNRYDHSCRYEIVTAQGERFETGFGRFDGSRIANLMRSGVGPSLDGLFTQSSLGIVTAATLWLPRKPKFHTSFLVTTRSHDRVGVLFDCIGEAARQGLIRDGSAFAMNSYKLASILHRRVDLVSSDAALGWDELSKHSKRWGHVQWLLNASVEGDTKALLRAKQKAFTSIFRSALGSGEHLVKISGFRSRVFRAISQFLPRPLAGLVGQLVEVFYEHTPLLGYPIDRPLRTVYWALPFRDSKTYQDLHGDSVGLLWVSVPLPLRRDDINEVCSIIDNGLLAFGFEPSTQVTLVSERLGRVITALMYDRQQPGQDMRALECQQSVYDELRRHGHYTYRLQSHLMEEYAKYGTVHQRVSARIKRALDPEDILDPSRYPATPEPRGTFGSET